MKARLARLPGALAACGLAITAFAAGEIRSHRTQVGDFSGGAWALAESTEGRFSVLMPAPFDDYTQASNTGDDRHGYFLRAKLPGTTTAFQAMRAEYADAAESAKNCRRAREESLFGDSLKSRRVFELDGHTAIEMTTVDGVLWMRMRIICLDTEGMILTVAALVAHADEGESMSSRFFDSLKFRP